MKPCYKIPVCLNDINATNKMSIHLYSSLPSLAATCSGLATPY